MAGRWQRLMSAVASPEWDRVLVPVTLIGFALARAGRFEERDPYWQARAGLENLAGMPLARPDSWSWSGVPGLWYQNSPLWNTALGASYGLGGFWGMFAFTAAVMAAYFLVDYLLALRLGARRLPTLVAILATVAPAISMLSPRATLMVEVMMLASVWIVIELSRRDLSRLPTIVFALLVGAVAAVLSALGNQLHLSFLLIGPALGGVWAVVWLLTPIPWPRRIAAAAFGGFGWLAGVLASPYGVGLGLERIGVVQEVCAGLILEWTSPFTPGIPVIFAGAAAAATVAAVLIVGWLWSRLRRRTWAAEETGLLALALIGVPAAVAGWWAIRFLGIALLILAPAVAVVATRLLDRARSAGAKRPPRRWREYTTGAFWRVVATGVAVVLLPGALWLVSLHAVPTEASVIGKLPYGCRLFSSGAIEGEFDGAVILIRPDVLVWVDGRADFYGRAHLIQAADYLDQAMPTPVPAGTTCVLVDSAAAPATGLLAAMSASPQWRLASSDGAFRLFVPVS